MSKDFFIKVLGLSLVLVVVINFLLLIFGRVPHTWFWIVVVFAAIMAWGGIPWLRKMK